MPIPSQLSLIWVREGPHGLLRAVSGTLGGFRTGSKGHYYITVSRFLLPSFIFLFYFQLLSYLVPISRFFFLDHQVAPA